jgi:nickel/cobalt transporter (NicO) family protein
MKWITIPFLALFVCAASLPCHPMGNFSINHYSKLTVTPHGIDLNYALDFAEIPTVEMLQQWQLEKNSSHEELQKRVEEQTRDWLSNLTVTIDKKSLRFSLRKVGFVLADGAGDLPILRVSARANVEAVSGSAFEYEDHNYPQRAGWKEIVIDAGAGTSLRQASQTNADISKGLTEYPPDPTTAPPQDLLAEAAWTIDAKPTVHAKPSMPAVSVIMPIAQPQLAPKAAAPALRMRQSAPLGTVVRGDFLSKVLHGRELTNWMLLCALGATFALGAAHALTPGHGKTIVAAYLVGSRGTLKHAAFLGAMVTFTHTISVFLLGLATLFLFHYVVPERITQWLGAISGLSIVAVGAWMLRKRAANGGGHSHLHPHHHHHHDDHGSHGHSHDGHYAHSHQHSDHAHHHHDHVHTHDHIHDHDHIHSHGGDHGHVHSHVPDKISWGALVALGASGGLVPCESALILLLGAIALGRVGLGLLLLIAFSLGLALVLMSIGAIVLYAKNLLPERTRDSSRGPFKWFAIASPAVVMVVGLVMTAVSLGWIRPEWAI